MLVYNCVSLLKLKNKIMKITELPVQKFTSDNIDNSNNWIKEEANKNGLTVEMTDERIMFITKSAT